MNLHGRDVSFVFPLFTMVQFIVKSKTREKLFLKDHSVSVVHKIIVLKHP